MIVIALLIFSCGSLVYGEENLEGNKVQSVEVQLDFTEPIYEGLQERIEYSISRVGEKILISQPVSILEENRDQVELAINSVFSKVLVGFKIESVEMSFAQNTRVKVRLTPLAPQISTIGIDLTVKNVSPEVAHLTSEIAEKVETEINQIFKGLPVASISWADGIFTLVINYLIEKEFPGFKSKFTIEPGKETLLKLVMTPVEPVVTEVKVNFASSTIPIWLLKAKVRDSEEKFNLLKGLPVDFLTHYQRTIEKIIVEQLNSNPSIMRYGLTTQLTIVPGTQTNIRLVVDSENYQTNLEARYFFGEEQSSGNVQGYFGYMFSDYEVFARGYLGENSGGKVKIGFKMPISTNLSGGFEYEFKQQYKDLWFHYQFERGDYLDLKLGLDNAPNEAVIGILLNDYLNLELAKIDKEFGLQLMFHFW